jgi:hypothetical protein
LRTKAALSAAYNIAPAVDTADTPVLATTGGNRGDGTKALKYADVLKLRTRFNKLNLPVEGRVLVLCPEHEEDLLAEDVERYNRMMTSGTLAGFKVYVFNGTARYSLPVTGQSPAPAGKLTYGATTGQASSLAFVKGEAMRAMGTIEGEPEKRWADYRGWLLGFQMRFVAQPFRNKGIASVYSAAA